MRSNRTLKTAVAFALASASAMALAQQPPAETTTTQLETVIVTGTYIRGTAEDAALPVDVITAEDLQKQGSPSTLEIMKTLNVSHGVLGDSNQFDARAQGSEGSGSVNLRGLGPNRTLVLLNGRRLVASPFTGAPDTNLMPVAAIGRLEVLKDGAAATYGSDAIGGVVNFITKTGKTNPGFEASADYKYIEDSDGDYTAGISFGWNGGGTIDFLVAAGYQHRSELMAKDRDWAIRSYFENPQGGYSAAGNPATIVPLPSGSALPLRDPQCATLGGTPGFVPAGPPLNATPVCYWQYTQFDALTEEEDRYQAYGEVNFQLGDTTRLHVEGLYSGTETPIYRTSPSYAALQTPSTPVPGFYFVPPNNPGYQAFLAANPGTLSPTAGALMVAYRPFALGGNPLFGYGSSQGPRRYHGYRVSAALEGSLGDVLDWTVAATYMEQENHREGYDTVVNRLQLALRGLGGPNCNGIVAGTPGSSGCFWLNPFGNAIPRNANNPSLTNPQFTSALANENRELLEWMFPKVWTIQVADLMVFDAVLNGELPISLPGGEIGWAFGGQFRDGNFKTEYSDLNNYAITPCVNSINSAAPGNIVGPSGCTPAQLAAPGGALLFLGGANNVDLSQDVYGVFAEFSLPVADSFQMQLAARFEDYGGQTGSTFDPKLAFKWEILDQLALRGSVGTTFRGPTANNVAPGSVTTLQNIGGTFRAIRTSGNPALEPESALAFNVGTIVKVGGLTATLDYWSLDMEKQIVTEPVAGIAATMFPGNSNIRCGDPAYAALQARFTFTTGGCGVGNIVRLDIGLINGPDLKTSGLDLSLNYRFDTIDLELGTNVSYTLEYETGNVFVAGQLVQAAFDAVGKLNYQTTAYPLPEIKGNLYAQYTIGDHTLRWQVNYVDSYEDQRTDIFVASASTNFGATGNTAATYNPANNLTITGGKTIESTTLHSLYYTWQMPADLTLTLGVENIFDEDPAFARLDYNYDPFTGSPFGRMVKAGVRAKF